MSTYADQYAAQVQKVLELKQQQQDRKDEIELQVSSDSIIVMGASREHVLNGRYATDPVLKDIQARIDQAVAEATMYGVGAMIKNLSFLSSKV